MNKKTGLILAKFAPFHKGHHFIIDTALEMVDELNIIMYDCPNLTEIPLNVRANWVRSFYPRVNVIEGWDAPNRHEDTDEVKRLQEKFVNLALNGKKITHFFSSDFYGEHMSKFLGAKNIRVDLINKKRCKIRATAIRNDKYKFRNYMDPNIYRDILVNVAIMGIPSQEQEKIVKTLAKHFNTIYFPNDILNKINSKKINIYPFADKIFNKESLFKMIRSARDYMFYNSTGFISHLISVAQHNYFDQKKYKFYSEDIRGYDLILINNESKNIIDKKFGFQKDIFMNILKKNLDTIGAKYQILDGSFDQKIKIAINLIKNIKNKLK